MNYPLVSVIIPCYNHADFVQETIRSVIEQNYKNIELIIIDDGSKDNSVEKIKKMIPECKLRFSRFEFRNRKNKGLCATLNEALDWSRGKYFSAIASDDILLSHKTVMQVDHLEKNNQTIAVFGGVEILYSNGFRKNIIKNSNSYKFKDILLHDHNLPAPTALVRLDAIKMAGGYREELIIEDWSMWLKLTEKGGRMDYLNQVFTCYRRHSGNLSGQFEKMHKGRLQILEIYSNENYYSMALSNVLLIHADEILGRKNKINIVIKSFFTNKKIIFKKRFYKTIIKILINRKMY